MPENLHELASTLQSVERDWQQQHQQQELHVPCQPKMPMDGGSSSLYPRVFSTPNLSDEWCERDWRVVACLGTPRTERSHSDAENESPPPDGNRNNGPTHVEDKVGSDARQRRFDHFTLATAKSYHPPGMVQDRNIGEIILPPILQAHTTGRSLGAGGNRNNNQNNIFYPKHVLRRSSPPGSWSPTATTATSSDTFHVLPAAVPEEAASELEYSAARPDENLPTENSLPSEPLGARSHEQRQQAAQQVVNELLGMLVVPNVWSHVATPPHTAGPHAHKPSPPPPVTTSPMRTSRSPSPQRRPIFSPLVHKHASENSFDVSTVGMDDEDDGVSVGVEGHFARLTTNDRALSLPTKSYTATANLPRKPSLKRVSSIPCCKPQNQFGSVPSDLDGPDLKRTVSFGTLETREFSIELSDHPSCSYGPPIQLGWDYHDQETRNVDEYETSRVPRRHVSDMILSYNVRRYLLLKRAGYTPAELRDAMRQVDKVKRERILTDLFWPVAGLDETLEEVVLRIKQVFGQGEESLQF